MIIGAAWLNEKDGQKYFYVRCDLPLLGNLTFMIKKRQNKTGNQPDYDVIWYPERKTPVVVPEEIPDDEVPL